MADYTLDGQNKFSLSKYANNPWWERPDRTRHTDATVCYLHFWVCDESNIDATEWKTNRAICVINSPTLTVPPLSLLPVSAWKQQIKKHNVHLCPLVSMATRQRGEETRGAVFSSDPLLQERQNGGRETEQEKNREEKGRER